MAPPTPAWPRSGRCDRVAGAARGGPWLARGDGVVAAGRTDRLTGALTVLLVVVSVALVTSVLMQSARGAGLTGSVGGGAEQIFGKKRGVDAFLSRLTVVLGIAFFLVALVIGFLQKG